ncbi:MAG TPA: DinB family protein, partial [Myxococcota bacterium]|nr:DinB family protein [Myxococcota bacterium]
MAAPSMKADSTAQIREATERFLAQCTSASDSQWLFRPTPTSWSMAQVTEHVALSNRNIYGMLTKRLLDNP